MWEVRTEDKESRYYPVERRRTSVSVKQAEKVFVDEVHCRGRSLIRCNLSSVVSVGELPT